MKLIVESDINKCQFIKEAQDPTKPKTVIIEGVFCQSQTKNGNGRIYPYEVLSKAVEEFQEKIQSKQALSELEHPSECTINPDRVCARTLSLVEDNKSWIGRSVVLASDPKFGIKGTPCGDILNSLLQFDCAIGHSTRGVGNVNEDTGEVEEYQMICVDAVTSPSIGIFNKSNDVRFKNGILESANKGLKKLIEYKQNTKFVNGILESKDFMIDVHGEIVEAPYHKFEKKLAKLPRTCIRSKKDEYVAEAIETFLGELC